MADELKPEERARIKIDEQLADAGWHIADRGGVTYEHNAIALVEGLLEGNKEADYLLFVDGKVVGVLEAKRSDIDLVSAAGGQAVRLVRTETPLGWRKSTMTRCATVCSEIGLLRFSYKVTDFVRYDKENFSISCKALALCTKTAKEKLTL